MAANVRVRGNALFVAFALGVGALPLLSASAAESITLKPVADTTVVKGKSSPLGSSKTLKADTSPQAETYVRFDLGSIDPATITRARLRLWVTNGSSNGPSLHPVSAPWDEATTNFVGSGGRRRFPTRPTSSARSRTGSSTTSKPTTPAPGSCT